MVKLFHLLQGYVKIKVWGYSPERFMNLCSNHGILIWDIENCGSYYVMCISIAGFFKLKSITKKTRTRVAILKRYGLPFFVPKMRRRFIFILGLFGCLLFLYLMSGYIWAIDLVGNQTITREVFLDFLEQNGVACGVKKKNMDIEALEKAIRQDFEVVTWTSAKLKGTRLYIQIKENAYPAPENKEKQKEGMDLEATNDGKIVHMITRSGVPQVKVKDSVKMGDVLVSGAVPVYGEDTLVKDYLFCQADADIYLECEYHFTEKLPIAYLCKLYTGAEKSIPYIKLFDREYRLPIKEPAYLKSDCLIQENQVKLLDDFYLPVAFGSYRYREYMTAEKNYGEEQAKKLLSGRLTNILESFREKGVQIMKKDVKIKKDSANYILQADFVVVEKTGTLVKTHTKPIEENVEFLEEEAAW